MRATTCMVWMITVGLTLGVIDVRVADANGWGYAPWIGVDYNGIPCKGRELSDYGPWDYRRHKDRLPVVEEAHFTRKVEQLVGGENSVGPMTDIDYTLTKIPNHHRALNSMIQQYFINVRSPVTAAKRLGGGWELRARPECYFNRAVNYVPDDEITLMLYAIFLQREGRVEEARNYYDKARELAPGTPNIEYNYALLLIELEEYSEARQIAKELYDGGFPLTGLKSQLVRLDQW